MSKLKEWYCKHQNAIKIGFGMAVGGLIGFGGGYLLCTKLTSRRLTKFNMTGTDCCDVVLRTENVSTDLPKTGVFEDTGALLEWWATSSPKNGTATYAMLGDIPIEKCGELGAKYSEAAQKCGYGAVNTIGYLFMCSESKGGIKCQN